MELGEKDVKGCMISLAASEICLMYLQVDLKGPIVVILLQTKQLYPLDNQV